VGPTAGLDGCGKSCLTGIRSPDRLARSESIHQLRYLGPQSAGPEVKTFLEIRNVLRKLLVILKGQNDGCMKSVFSFLFVSCD
jgi:hypothetical protein